MAARPDDLEIVPRRPEFAIYEAMRHRRYWLQDDPVLTHFINALQALFPEGERFFIDSARDVRDQVGEENLSEQLRADLQDFIRQEAWHGREHEVWIEALEELGYTRLGESMARMKKQREWAREHISAINRLAMTAASEHLTASIARLLLEKRPDLLDDADRPMRDLLAWHALEETEHKSVCFDLYQAAGGGYFRRCLALVIEWADLFYQTHTRHRYLLRKDGLWNWRTRLRVLRDIWGPRGVAGAVLPYALGYFKPGFHPWQTDERAAFKAKYGDLIEALSES